MMHQKAMRLLATIAVPVVLAACARFDHYPVLEPRGPEATGATAAQAPGSWRVQPGETLSQIAQRTGVPLASLAQANGIEPPFPIRAGQVLRIPGAGRGDVSEREPAVSAARPTAERERRAPPATQSAPDRPVAPQSVAVPPLVPARPATDPATAPTKRDVAVASLPPVDAAVPSPEPRADVAPPADDPETVAEPPPARGTGRFVWPVRGRVVLGYGPQAGGLKNDGINIAAPRGTPVRAADAGVVAYAGNELRGFGNLIVVRHADGWMTAYAHNETLLVQKGDAVRRGQTIARVGQTGNVTAPQLHFEVRRGQRPIDPMPHMAGTPDGGVVTSTGGRGDRRDPG